MVYSLKKGSCSYPALKTTLSPSTRSQRILGSLGTVALLLATEGCGTRAISSSAWERQLLCCVLRYLRPQGLGMVGEFLGQSSGVCFKVLSIPTASPTAPRAGARPTTELGAGRAEVVAATGFVWTLNINTEIMEGVPKAGLTHLETKLPRS